jgi:hypothetical protein
MVSLCKVSLYPDPRDLLIQDMKYAGCCRMSRFCIACVLYAYQYVNWLTNPVFFRKLLLAERHIHPLVLSSV